MATVFKAYEPRLDRLVAIKTLPEYLAADPEFNRRFEVEAGLVAALRHPSILLVYDAGSDSGQRYLVTEFVEGGTLGQRLGTPVTIAETVRVLTPVAAALDYAHRRGVLHRDVKPSNILLRGDGSPVLSDFGLARMADSQTRLTMTGVGVGTPEYMAPEQAEGGDPAPSADLYSLAVVPSASCWRI
jgi:serine/threonine-protein kinase